ncbi:hypothetical protein [Methanocalculus sp.]|uniref:hypothetical protein n=1 Tax=Methanocalculus sp. TaxID=2004547 RepID=UPI002718CC56|nr:hypothetical protein [Methanocalculus sp.]MDO8841692.1 hypothetical protein [Methanocalculus sp.]
MRKDDLIIFIAGLVVVLIISLLVHPTNLLPEISLLPMENQERSESLFLTEFAEAENRFTYPIFTIQLVDNPFGYPRVHMPGASVFPDGTFRLSEEEKNSVFPLFGKTPYSTAQYETYTWIEWVTVGILEQRRGGVSTLFSPPQTPVWRIRSEVTADRYPAEALFRYVLCEGETGAIIDGGEIKGAKTFNSIVFLSGREMYFIISAHYVDSYRIIIEVPKEYL